MACLLQANRDHWCTEIGTHFGDSAQVIFWIVTTAAGKAATADEDEDGQFVSGLPIGDININCQPMQVGLFPFLEWEMSLYNGCLMVLTCIVWQQRTRPNSGDGQLVSLEGYDWVSTTITSAGSLPRFCGIQDLSRTLRMVIGRTKQQLSSSESILQGSILNAQVLSDCCGLADALDRSDRRMGQYVFGHVDLGLVCFDFGRILSPLVACLVLDTSSHGWGSCGLFSTSLDIV